MFWQIFTRVELEGQHKTLSDHNGSTTRSIVNNCHSKTGQPNPSLFRDGGQQRANKFYQNTPAILKKG